MYVYLYLPTYLAAISLTAAVPLPVVGGQVLVLVFHHHLQDGSLISTRYISLPYISASAIWGGPESYIKQQKFIYSVSFYLDNDVLPIYW